MQSRTTAAAVTCAGGRQAQLVVEMVGCNGYVRPQYQVRYSGSRVEGSHCKAGVGFCWKRGILAGIPHSLQNHPTLLRYSPDPRLRQDLQVEAGPAFVPPSTRAKLCPPRNLDWCEQEHTRPADKS